MGVEQRNAYYFDTLRLQVPGGVEEIQRRALASGINFRYPDEARSTSH
jgi:hypothetical protein